MLTVKFGKTRRGAGSLVLLCALAAFCGGLVSVSRAQPAPPNDLLANAQGITGTSGIVQATNINANVQGSEPLLDPSETATVWFVWTAPTSGEIDFNTRNSTDTNGAPLDTALAVYQLGNTLQPAGFGNLTRVAANEQDPSGGVTSRVDFQASLGTTYFIQVGIITNAGGFYSEGYPFLNWGPSLAAGGFGFSAAYFPMSSLENWLPDNDGSISPSLYGFVQGTPNARITVTRSGGSIGRCEVTLSLGTAYYTNTYETNYLVTNVFATNFTTNIFAPANVISFTNIFTTNIASINNYANYQGGGIIRLPADADEEVTLTNANGTIVGPIFTLNPLTGFGLPDFFTNFTCPLNPPFVDPVSSGFVQNSDGTWTWTTTNIFCQRFMTNVLVPAAIVSGPNAEIVPFTKTLVFDDFQMSQDVYVELYPELNTVANGGSRDPNEFSSVVDYPTMGPEDDFQFQGSAYGYTGLNGAALLTLSNPVLDPLEDQDIVPPTISQSNSYISILNFYGYGSTLQYSNSSLETISLNLERYTDRCNKDCKTAVVWCQRSDRAFASAATHTMHYTIDSRLPNITWIDDNVFATVAGSDYAVPSAGQADFDFRAPLTGGAGYDTNTTPTTTNYQIVPAQTTWTAPDGTLTFPMDTISPAGIYIPIVTNGAVEFDEDIEIQLYLTLSDATSDAGAMPPAVLGPVDTGRLTINFDWDGVGIQPGGAVDKRYNVDGVPSSSPPDNLIPGANQPVNAVAIDAFGNAVIGGDFDAYDTTPINYVARLLTNGFLDTSFATGLGRGPNGFVNAITLDASGHIIIGGEFTSVNATNAHYIARLNYDGSLDTNFVTGQGFNNFVNALAIDANGNILVGGNFTSFNTTNCNHIARLLPTGGLDTSFLPSSGIGLTNGTDQPVFAVTNDSVGRIVLGGRFTVVNGTNWSRIARLTARGNLDTTFNPGLGADGDVLALAVQSDNSIVMGGAFQNFNLISRNSILRLTPSGALDTSFAPGSGFNDIVYSLILQPDGNILVGGQFTSYNGTRRVGLARLLGGVGQQAGEGGWLDTSFMDTAYNQFAGVINHYYNTNAYDPTQFPFPVNTRNQILGMSLQSDSNIVVGGNFSRLGGGFTRTDVHTHVNVARIIGQSTPGPEEGGIGNCPGNVGMTQNPYSAEDTGGEAFITLNRVNGSLGPLEVTLGTNTLPASSSSATAADFGLLGTGTGDAVSLYNTVWRIADVGPATYGWRSSDGEYGFNNNAQPDAVQGAGSPNLFLSIHNDVNAAPILYADLNLLGLTGNLITLGGVPMPFGPALGQYSAGLDIINDNEPAGTIGFSTTNYSVLESAHSVIIPLLRTNGIYGTVSVTVNALNGTAIDTTGNPNGDYTWTTKTVQFAAGVTSNFVTIPIVDHSTQQSNKFFTIYLSAPTGGALLDTTIPPLVSSNAVVKIIDDHFQPGYLSFSEPAYSVLKPGVATITVTRNGAALDQVSVEVGTSNGTAVNGVNYVGSTNTLSWDSQDITPRTITVPTLQDSTVEGTKTVNLFLFNPQVAGSTNLDSQVLQSPSNAVLSILDTDSYGTLNFLTANFIVFQNAGQALITVTRTNGTVGNVTVQFETYALSSVPSPFQPGVAGSNYGTITTNLTFANGVSSQTIAVPVYTTSTASPADRMVGLRLFSGNPTNIASQFPQTAILTILDPRLHLNEAGAVDTTTQNGSGFNGVVNSLSLQPDASLLAAGEFSLFNDYPFNNTARLLQNGDYDTGFLFNMPGPNGTVWQILSQTPSAGQLDGNIMIVGDFNQVNLVNSPGIARMNLNGGLDTSFNPGAGADATVYAITEMLLPASTTNLTPVPFYVIGGTFANYNGNPSSGVARILPTGALDPNFNLGVGVSGSNGAVHAVAVTPANQILVGGDFTSFDNRSHHHLVRLNVDGTLDTNFAAFDGISSDINGSVRAIVVQPDGGILIGGLFTTVNGSNLNYIARLTTQGTLDTNFNVGVGCNNSVEAIALDDQLRILVGGTFTQASGVTRNGLTRFNADGSVDPSINFGFGANGYVDSIVIQTNEEIDVAGGFSTFNNIPENGFARLFGGANVGNGSIQFAEQVYGALENGTNAVINIQRIGGTFGTPDVTAIFSTSNGTAINGQNYTGVTNTVSFPLGETFETVKVPLLFNSAVGPDLTVNLLLTNPPANTEEIGPQVSAELVITNVNAGVEFAATGFQQSATASTAAIPIVRVGDTNTTVAVTVYTGTNGTAVSNVNFIAATNVLTFYPGQLTNYFLVQLLNSQTTFQDTTVDLELADGSNAIVASPSSATLTIQSSLTGPGFVTFSQTNFTVSEGATNAVITVLRTNGNDDQVTVYLTTSDGTAQAGINYSNASTQLVFPTGVNIATDNIPIIQLSSAGPNTTVNLSLSQITGGAALVSPTTAVLTIVNDIAGFRFSAGSYFVNENAGTEVLTILRTGPTNGTASVYYGTTNVPGSNGVAVAGVDYLPVSGQLVFPPGETLETISVPILQTTNVTTVQSFDVVLEDPSPNSQIGVPGVATVGIVGDVTGFYFATNSYVVGENGSNIIFTVNRLNPNTGPLSVQFATVDGTAVHNVDYLATNGTLHFQNGQSTTNITVPIINPNLVENDKTFSILLSNPSSNSYVIPPSTAVVTITNVYIGLAFGSPNFTVSECAVSETIPVLLTGLTNSTVTLGFATADGSGVAGVNYVPTNGNLTFLPGQTVAYFDVDPINNHVLGPDHTVQLNLTYSPETSPETAATAAGVQLLSPSSALLTIEECNGAFVIKSGTAFVTGSIQPSSGVIYSNDRVTILMGLRDIAGGNATNLVATLLATNGITNVASAQPYGTLMENGPTVARPFTFTVLGSNGQNITATLQLSDAATNNLGTVQFGFTIAGTTLSFTNSAAIFLPENQVPPTIATNSQAPGFGYPSLIDVSGAPGLITGASVTISNFSHTYPSDVDIVLRGPNGSNSVLLSHTGGSTPVADVTLTITESAAADLPTNRLSSGSYLPTAYNLFPYSEMPQLPPVPTNETVPVSPPESPYPYGTNLSVFLGSSPNGYWSLWAISDENLDSGAISNGWILHLSTGVAVENDSDLEVTVNPLPAQATTSNLLTYFVTVTNYGPSSATNVVISDYLPSGTLYATNGVTNGVLAMAIPAMPVGGGTSFSVSVTPTNLGYITNIVTALAQQPNPNSNYMITNINLVNPPSADLGLVLTGGPSPVNQDADVTFSVEVTNGGPSEAADVVASLVLPPGFIVITNGIVATTGTWTNVSGTVTWTIPSLNFNLTGAGPTMTVATEATTAGVGLAEAFVSSDVYDPLKGNNFGSIKIQVNQTVLPTLSVSGQAPYVLSWSGQASNFYLQGAVNLQGPWTAITPAPTVSGNGQYTFTLPGANGYRFFRLSTQIP